MGEASREPVPGGEGAFGEGGGDEGQKEVCCRGKAECGLASCGEIHCDCEMREEAGVG